jgi:hypothetical protein
MSGLFNFGSFFALFAIPFCLILGVLILILARSAMKSNSSRRWPSTDGTIIASTVESHRSYSSSSHTHTTMYSPRVVYEYSVEGRRYQNQTLNFGTVASASMPVWAESTVGRYPRGANVQVFYNPSKPTEAVLEHKVSRTTVILLLVLLPVEIGLIVFTLVSLSGQGR